MSEWWTYRLDDFLMFSPAAYARLLERYNLQAWPLHVAALGTGAFLLWLATTRCQGAGRVIALVLAPAWLAVGWGFHWQAYSQINWGARYFAGACAIQAGLLLMLGLLRRQSVAEPSATWRAPGLALAAAGVLAYPFAAPLAGRPWSQAEVFALMPEPTALATLGLLLAIGSTWRGALAVIPVLSLAVGWTTQWLLAGL